MVEAKVSLQIMLSSVVFLLFFRQNAGLNMQRLAAVYTGQTSRTLKTRTKEHSKAASCFDKTYQLAQHSQKTGHSFDFENVSILHICPQWNQRLFLEAWYSNKEENSVNEDAEFPQSRPIVSPFYKPPPGQEYEKINAIRDHTYEEFYGKGKKNKISHTAKKSLSSSSMKLTREALLKATSAQTTALVAAAEAARSSLEISELAQKAQDISVKRALWALKTIKVAAKAEEVAVNAIQTMFI